MRDRHQMKQFFWYNHKLCEGKSLKLFRVGIEKKVFEAQIKLITKVFNFNLGKNNESIIFF